MIFKFWLDIKSDFQTGDLVCTHRLACPHAGQMAVTFFSAKKVTKKTLACAACYKGSALSFFIASATDKGEFKLYSS
ncbi:hypothetical protein [Pedobacter arcticus]|uniref:hypothetical protein n=1 Tax=Pedobacter arcticus TaxID=752140 RepID=UPI00037EAAEF|nr:hypothetical protein [Pedobacter arcticus]